MALKARIAAIGLVILAATATPPASATPNAVTENPPRPLAACRSDALTLCKDAPQGHGQRTQCLLANKDKASPECQAALQNFEQLRAARRQQGVACRGDIKSLCANVAKGYAVRVACLKQNEAKLSPTCKAALAQPSPTAQ